MINKVATRKRLSSELEKSAALGEMIGFLRGRVDKKEGTPMMSSLGLNTVLGAGAEAGMAYGGLKAADALMKYLTLTPLGSDAKKAVLLWAALTGGLGAIAGTAVARSIIAGPPKVNTQNANPNNQG